MKTTFGVSFAVLFFLVIISCKKDVVESGTQLSFGSQSSDAIASSGILGRQRIISLPTGDPTFKTSQALLWIPPKLLGNNKNSKDKFPLIFNLYGQGQCGTDLNLMFQDNTMCSYIANGFNAIAKNPKDGKTYSFFVCSPQCPTSWGWSAPQVNVMLQTLVNKLPIDESRIYITGFSAGGWGLWSCMTDNDQLTKQFAAIVPISSAAADNPEKITNVDKYGIACLNICGDQDAFYPTAVSYTNTINANKPPIPAILNTLKGVGHSAWVQAYDPTWKKTNGLNIYEWMLQYQLK